MFDKLKQTKVEMNLCVSIYLDPESLGTGQLAVSVSLALGTVLGKQAPCKSLLNKWNKLWLTLKEEA